MHTNKKTLFGEYEPLYSTTRHLRAEESGVEDEERLVWYTELREGSYYRSGKNSKVWECVDLERTKDGMTHLRRYVGSGVKVLLLSEGYYTKINCIETKGEDKMENKLYEINLAGIITYGNYLATNSQSQWVMEEKGTGRIITVAKDQATEVLPHSIAVRFVEGGKKYHYLADANKFSVGFYILNGISGSYSIAEVVELNTKSKAANKEFTPVAKLSVDKLITSEG